jgi:hypothetical protein
MKLELAHEQSFLDYTRRPTRYYRVRLAVGGILLGGDWRLQRG